jgi:hypothetical protein
MKKNVVRCVALLMTAVLLTGCFSTSWLVHLRKDGSGTIDMEYRLDKQVIQMMQSMGEGGEEPMMSSEEFIEEQNLRELAAGMGKGVRFVSAEPMPENGESIGFSARFEFDDINTVSIDPMEGAPEQDQGDFEEEEDAGGSSPFTFRFEPGRTAELTVLVAQDEDEDDASSTAEESAEGDQEMMAEMMKPYFRSMSFLVQVEIEGSIRSTNASYRDGNTITLMDLDMGKIVDDEELFRKVINSEKGIGDKEMLAQMETAGVRIEQKERVNVSFR